MKKGYINPNNPVYFSYAWANSEHPNIEEDVENLCELLEANHIYYKRDKTNLYPYRWSIQKAEEEIGEGTAIIVVISERYLKSLHCMNEWHLMRKNGKIWERVFPIVLEDANITDKETFKKYYKYYKEREQLLIEQQYEGIIPLTRVETEAANAGFYIDDLKQMYQYFADYNTSRLTELKKDNYEVIINQLKDFLKQFNIIRVFKPNDFGFRLLRLKISGHPVLKNVDITFCDDNTKSFDIYTTGIIGANGTGKSHLMGAVASVFSEIHEAKHSKRLTPKRFSFIVDYECMGDIYSVWNAQIKDNPAVSWIEPTKSLYALRNGQAVELSDVVLPERVIASTMTVTDKFLARSNEFYRYKGIRNEKSYSMTGTRTIIRKTVESLMDCMSSKSLFQDELRILLNNLGLDEHLHVSYEMRYKTLFLLPEMNVDMLRERFENWKKYFPNRRTAPWGYNNYFTRLSKDEDALKAVADFLAEKSMTADYGSSIVINYDLMSKPEEFQRDAKALKALTQLDLVSFPSVHVVKEETAYGLENSSSGETHLLCQFIGIMADIRHNSLVLIDEPENSSHPDWQMNYVGWIKNIFSEYSDCHFVIATHSPLILANMKPSESTIIRLKRNEQNRIVEEGGMENGCYSWTVDEILQEVMKMKNNRTKEFSEAIADFEKALDEDNKSFANEAYNRLVQLIRPGNELAEMLKIQMIGLTDKND